MNRFSLGVAGALLVLALALLLVVPAAAGTITVSNGNDSGPGSLRQALDDAQPGDTILFDGDYTITLNAPLTITKRLTIDSGGQAITVSGDDAVRVFRVLTDTHATLDGLTIAHGRHTSPECWHYTACGAGLKIESDAVVTLTRSAILSNTAESYDAEHGLYVGWGGGVMNLGTLTAISTTFAHNVAASGGGLANYGGTATISNSTVYSNTATEAGGGIDNWLGGTLTVQNCAVYDNLGYDGGGLSTGSLPEFPLSSLAVINSAFFGNTAYRGAGIDHDDGPLAVTNTTFYDNYAFEKGGGLYNDGGTASLANSILWGNDAWMGGPQIYNEYGAVTGISYSDVQDCGGSGSGWDPALGSDGGGNVDADPLFVAAAGDDLRLRLNSPAIDAGDNSALPTGAATDLDGNPRFADVPGVADTGSGSPPLVDMGAYEATLALALHKSVTPAEAVPYHGIVTYTLSLANSGARDDSVVLTDTLPAGVAFGGWVSRPAGTIRQGRAITWTDTVTAGQGITAVFTAIHAGDYGQVITNTAHASGTIQSGNAEATFVVQAGYTLSVQVGGAGSGAIGSDPPGIQCGAACTAIYGDGTVVTLTATAETGSAFAGWSGDAAGASPTVTTTMTADRAITATFEVLTYTLAVHMDGEGGGSVTLEPPGGVYDHGTVVTLTATPDAGSVFAGWSGACSGASGCVLTMTMPRSVTATFDLVVPAVYLPLIAR